MPKIDRPDELGSPAIEDLKCLDSSPDCVKFIDTNGDLLYMNRVGLEALSVQESAASGVPWLTLLPASVAKSGAIALERARNGASMRFIGVTSGGAMGPRVWDNLLTPVIGKMGETREILCISRDVTDQHDVQVELLALRRRIVEQRAAKSAQRADPDSGPPAPTRLHEELSAKERECLYWTASGKTASETALIMKKSRRTIEFHLANAIRKLDAANKIQAAVTAAVLGLLEPPG
jgi:DNA-binding CsgD family transcriptional regulator